MVELFVYGLIYGSIIALGAIGVTLVYGILRFANFAHGDLMSLGAYMAFFLVTSLFDWIGIPDVVFEPFSFGLRMILALPLAMVLVSAVAIGFDKLVFQKLRQQGSSSVFIAMAALGVSFLIRMSIYVFWGPDFLFFRPGVMRAAVQMPLGVKIRPDQFVILLVTCGLFLGLHLFLKNTKLGKAMRAAADNMDLARISGINIDRIVIWTWVIGGSLAAAAGILYGMDVQLNPAMGWNFLLPLFAAVILGLCSRSGEPATWQVALAFTGAGGSRLVAGERIGRLL